MKRKNNIAAVVLLSGGIDSSLAAALALSQGRQVHALAVDYGQRHKKELLAAQKQAKALGIQSFKRLHFPLNSLAAGSLVDGSKVRQSGVKPGLPKTYVSFRNGVLLSLAAAAADALKVDEIWGGWCLADRSGYPDCRPAFLKAMEKAARLGTSQKKLKVITPLSRMSKKAIIQKGLTLGLDFSKTWTCYLGKAHPCRLCDACRIRALGFKAAGLEDPLR